MRTNRPDPSWTTERLQDHFGKIPADRIIMAPPPGKATARHLVAVEARQSVFPELVDRALIRRASGFRESALCALVIRYLWEHVERDDLGIVLTAGCAFRLRPGLIRRPSCSFTSWDRIPGGAITDADEPIPRFVPDLAVELLAPGNTGEEMRRKIREYFEAGVRLVWWFFLQVQAVLVFTGPDEETTLEVRAGHSLAGGVVLPGFSLPLEKLFAGLHPRHPRKRSRKR